MHIVFGGAEADNQHSAGVGTGLLRAVAANGTAADIVSTPTLVGSLAFEVDPVNGVPVLETYGWEGEWDSTFRSSLFSVSFMFRFAAKFTGDGASVVELSNSGALKRLLVLNVNARIQLFDNAIDLIGDTGDDVISINTNYRILMLHDLRFDASTYDAVWLHDGSSWTKLIEVLAHGDSGGGQVNTIIMGSTGKTLPSGGGPYYFDDLDVQLFDQTITHLPIGSAATKYCAANAQGDDLDFDAGDDGGSGDGNPHFRNVDDNPPDFDTTYDMSGADEDEQSYECVNADANDVPLAVCVSGAVKSIASASSDARSHGYLFDGTTKEEGIDGNTQVTDYRIVSDGGPFHPVFQEFDGKPFTESIFNGMQAGIHQSSRLAGGDDIRISSLGLEYVKEGPVELPVDFPLELVGVHIQKVEHQQPIKVPFEAVSYGT